MSEILKNYFDGTLTIENLDEKNQKSKETIEKNSVVCKLSWEEFKNTQADIIYGEILYNIFWKKFPKISKEDVALARQALALKARLQKYQVDLTEVDYALHLEELFGQPSMLYDF